MCVSLCVLISSRLLEELILWDQPVTLQLNTTPPDALIPPPSLSSPLSLIPRPPLALSPHREL